MKRAVQPLHPTDTLTPIENKQTNKTTGGCFLKLKNIFLYIIYFRKVLFYFTRAERVLSYHLIRVPWKGSGSFQDRRIPFAHFPCRADMVLMLYGTALFWMKITDLRLLFISTNAFNRSNYRFHISPCAAIYEVPPDIRSWRAIVYFLSQILQTFEQFGN